VRRVRIGWPARRCQADLASKELGVTSGPLLRLDEMDEQQAFDFLARQLATLSADEEYALRHEDT
jgi:hypothetical protein